MSKLFFLVLIIFAFVSGGYSQTTTYYKVKTVDLNSVADKLPVFTWEEDGVKLSSEQYAGKVVMVNLWATWCGPCRKEVPDLTELYSELNDQGFELIGIHVWFDPRAMTIDEFLTKYKVSYKILDGNDDVVKVFQKCMKQDINGIPTTLIFNKEGYLKEVIVGSNNKEYFKNLVNKYL